ncbi:NAD(P)/FAD-dependent oxidoreductase [Microvirga sp. VF16]|uniref:FAD-dependent oxidoreductase n=1 Tax=Microvirga sp. VF16 TaxID=2807101 RepID=UPI00193DED66|nr:FAD-dependent monooxygenase [Microvirga sp. VF16]QRM35364.1 FAD-binding monooxygenase [Microvirga sp. VF16]
MRSFARSQIRTPRRPLGHAVVLGGSIAGLFAARVLSDHFAQVTVIERDGVNEAPEPRKGAPQGNHLHALLARGRMIADDLLPGLSDELAALGAVRLNAGRDFAWYYAGGWRMRHDSDLVFLSMSRPLLEGQIDKRVRALPNVTIINGVRIIGLRAGEDSRVTGVRLAEPGRSAPVHEIMADLVVDATGRGSATPQWLNELGFPVPATELVGARVAYATRTFPRNNGRPDWGALVITGKPSPRSGLIFPIEGDRWLVTLPGFSNEPMPQDDQAFLTYARSLAVPDLFETIRQCEPLSQIKHFRFAGSLRHRYERLEHFPEGLIVLGDAVCSFNPVYGQGMTVAAIEAEALGRMLAEAETEGGLEPTFTRRWFQTIKPIVDAAWRGVLLEDFRLPELADQRPLRMRPMQWYMDRVQRATHRSAYVTSQFYRVMNFLDPPTRLFRPRMLSEVMLAAFRISPGNTSSRNTPPHHVLQAEQ